MKMDDNGKCKLATLFGKMEWGPKAYGWSQLTYKLTAEKWKLITAEVTLHGKKLPQDEANGEDMEVDPHSMLEL